MIERNFNLHLTAGHSTALVINANQFDQGEKWIFTLYNENGTQYIPSTGAIVGIKSDGLGIINSGSVVDGKVVIMETEQMTAAVGKAVFELMIDSQTHGTANFIVLVEPKPGNNADLSESDLSLLQEAIDATSPLPTGGTVGQVLTKTANGSAWSDAGTPTQEQVADAVSDWADEHITVSTGVVIDTSLSVAGAAADAKKTGDEITDLKSAVNNIAEQTTSPQLLDSSAFIEGYTLENTVGVSTPDDLIENSSLFVTNTIELDEPLTENTVFALNIEGISRILSYVYLNDDYVRSGSYSSSNVATGTNYRYITIAATQQSPIYKIRISAVIASNPNFDSLFFVKESDWSADMSLDYGTYVLLKGFLPKENIIDEDGTPINYEGEEVRTFYKGIAIGDSLTEGTFNTEDSQFVVHKQYAYPMYFYKKTGVTLRNFGVGGTTAQTWYERYQNVTFPVYDFAIIALGVNDILQSVNPSTTVTYINNIVTKLQSANADVKCFIATVNKAYSASSGWEAMNTAIRSYVASKANCYLLDIAQYGLTEPNTPYVNGHLTALGYNELAREFANLISWNVANNKADFDAIQFSGTTYTNLPTD